MTEQHNHRMAVDLLRCHLGITEEEAMQQLQLTQQSSCISEQILDTHNLQSALTPQD